jgi:hypothetical protein
LVLIKTVGAKLLQVPDEPNRRSKVLLKLWYAKGRRKVPESWEKNHIPRGRFCFVRVLGFLLAVVSGTKQWRETHPEDRSSAGNDSVYPTGKPLELLHDIDGTGKLLARHEIS